MEDISPIREPLDLLDRLTAATTEAEAARALVDDAVARLGWASAAVWRAPNRPVALAGDTALLPPLANIHTDGGSSLFEVGGHAALALPLGGAGALLVVISATLAPPPTVEPTVTAARIAGLALSRVAGVASADHASVILQRLLHHVPSVVALTRGPNHVVEIVNEAFLRVLRKGPEAVIGLPIREALPGIEAQGIFRLVDRVYQTGERFQDPEMYAELRYAEETVPTWHNVLYEPVRDAEGQIDGVFLFSVDVTALVQARKEAEAALAELGRMQAHLIHLQKMESIGRMASGIAHDFNNLLGVILGNLSLLMDGLLPGDPLLTRAESARNAVDQAGRLTLQLLGLAGRGLHVPQPVDLRASVDETVRLLRPVIPRGTTLRTQWPAAPIVASVDAQQLHEVLTTLLLQAVEALDEGAGAILVGLEAREVDAAIPLIVYGQERLAPGRYAVVVVRDNGRGMDEATQTRLFDPFFRTQGTGRGLGLASLLAVIRSHGGGVRVESAPGAGTTVEVLLPLVPPAVPAAVATTEAQRPSPPVAPRQRPARALGVLIVDDEELIRELLICALAPLGCQVFEASDRATAVGVADAHAGELDVIILDLTLPDATGDEAWTALRSRLPDARVILCSGLGEGEARQLAGVGVEVPYLRKPFDIRDVARLVGGENA